MCAPKAPKVEAAAAPAPPPTPATTETPELAFNGENTPAARRRLGRIQLRTDLAHKAKASGLQLGRMRSII